MTEQIRVYFAAPLFTQPEWHWNARLAKELTDLGLEIILPQAEAEPMLKGHKAFDAGSLFSLNIREIENADVVLAVLDQADPDSGTCWECGFAYKAGRPIIGLRTDFRPAGDDADRPVNLMLARSCKAFVALPANKIDDFSFVAEQVAGAIREAFNSESPANMSLANHRP
jgi:nucleoside 2-deoxyribosyltransferase